MSILTSKEMFINMKNPPKYNPRKNYFDQTKEVLDFYNEERRKIEDGVYIGGYFVHPWLYFHLNFFKTPIPVKGDNPEMKKMSEVIMNPPLDDNFMYVVDSYREAEESDKGLFLFGCRGSTKSTSLSSLTQWLTTTKANGTVSITGGSDGDLKTISRLMETGFNNTHEAFYLPRLISDWDKQIQFGIKGKDNRKLVHSYISITNANKGTEKDSEKSAGLSPVGAVYDEALVEDSLLYTESGEITIKDVKAGDFIYDDSGNLTEVVDKINPGVVDVYEFTFSDGRKIQSSDNHLWKIYTKNSKKWSEKTTEEIRESYYSYKRDNRYNKINKFLHYAIPLSAPVNYPEKDLPVEPYYLGLHLGDGLSRNANICTIDQEIKDYIKNYTRRLGLKYAEKERSNAIEGEDFRICTITQPGVKGNILVDRLRELNITNNKHIPDIYLKASFEQRLELLRGLMDSDGSCSKSSNIEFSSSIDQLADGFEELCHSLGISIKRTLKETHYTQGSKRTKAKDTHRFRLYTDLPVFRLTRKLELMKKDYNEKSLFYRMMVNIENIEYIGKKQSYCIKVSNKSKLFLTTNYVVTHNCGKYEVLKPLMTELPSYTTQYGAKLVHLLTGTGGNKELSKDAKTILSDPEAYNLILMNWERLDRSVPEEAITWTRSKKDKFSIFFPGQMSYRLPVEKITQKFSDFIGIKHKDLSKIDIRVTDWRKATETIKNKNKSLKKESDRHKNQMYYPLEIADCFLTSSDNPFPVTTIEKHIRKLEDEGKVGKNIGLYREGKDYKYEFVQKQRAQVSHGGGVADAPILLFNNFPEGGQPPRNLFVSGLDGYKLDESQTSSLGSMYVIKRRNQAPNEPCETIAASYTARPERMRDFHRNCELMSDTWNAECLMESLDMGFKQYLEGKGRHYDILHEALSLSESSQKKKTTLRSGFGMYPTKGNKEQRFNLLVDYCKEEHLDYIDDEGNPIYKLGVEYIDDIDLLKEMRDWYHGGNFDRIDAFSHALVLARELDKKDVQPVRQVNRKEEYDKKELERRQRLLGKNRYGMNSGNRYGYSKTKRH